MTWATVNMFGLLFLIGSISAASHHKIFGGDNAVIKQFPHLVSIREFGGHFCGGSIISDRHILTAGHCMITFIDSDMKFLTVHSGTSSIDKKGTEHKILSIRMHPKLNLSNIDRKDADVNDIAILTLEEPIVFNKYQQKISLPSHDVEKNEVGYAIGWGRTSTRWSTKQLQKLKVVLLPSDKCKPMLIHYINEKQVCAFRSVHSGVCHGDSGGSLVSHGEIVGIASFVDKGRCGAGVPDVYTNVFTYKDFIESVVNE